MDRCTKSSYKGIDIEIKSANLLVLGAVGYQMGAVSTLETLQQLASPVELTGYTLS